MAGVYPPAFPTREISMQQAREFISRVLPWPPAGQPGAYMNIHHSFEKHGQPKLIWAGRAVQSVNDAVQAVSYQLTRPDTRGIYICMSSQRVAVPKQVANGFTMWKAQRSTAAAVELKSFFIDIDVKPDAYPTQAEALKAFGDFLQATGLPTPTVAVDTGSGGFHVHWICARPMKPDEWKVYAFALNNAIMQHGLIADQQCTIDAARILRVPDTYNMKTGTQRPIKFLTQMLPADYDNQIIFDALKPYLGQPAVTQHVSSALLPAAFHGVTPPSSNVSAINAMAAGVTREARPIILQDVVPECAFIADAFKTGGANYDNALWNLTTLIATFAEDGRNLAHDMSKGHATYTAAETDALFTRKSQERINNNIGWPQCRTIASSGCTACQSCPHFNAGKSPLHFGRPANLPPAPVSDLPSNYTRDSRNLVYHMKISEDGESIAKLVSSYPLCNGWIQLNPPTLLFTTTTSVGREHQVQIPLADLDGKDKMSAWLRSQSFIVESHEAKGIGEFLLSWSKQLQSIRSLVVDTNSFGWVVNNGKEEGFAYAGKVYTESGEKTAANAPPGIDVAYKPRGELQPWKDAAKLITNQKRAELNLILASAFAGPLMRFTGQPGALVSAYSTESGIGKTSAMKVAQSVFGDPVLAMQALDDTNNSVLNKIGVLRSLTIFWDEIKTEDDVNKFIQLAFTVTGGKEKTRLTKNIQQREPGTWETMLIVASNDSLVDAVSTALKASEAGAMRLFEYVVTPGVHGQIGFGDAGQIVHKTHDNFGRAGEVYSQYLGANHVQVKSDIAKCLNSLEKAMGGKPEERFWFCCAATLIMGARYSNILGLTEIDEPGLVTLCKDIIKNMRLLRIRLNSNIKSAYNVWDILTQFLSAMRARHTLWTDTLPTGPGKPIKARILRDASRLEGVYVHIALKTGVIRISRYALMQWLVEHNHGRHLFTQELEGQFGFKNLNSAKLGGGTSYSTPNQYLLEGMFVGTPLADWIESMGEDAPVPETFNTPVEGETIEKAIARSNLNPIGNP